MLGHCLAKQANLEGSFWSFCSISKAVFFRLVTWTAGEWGVCVLGFAERYFLVLACFSLTLRFKGYVPSQEVFGPLALAC